MKIGFLINPVAGMGGRVGLKGTDDMAARAAELGARPVAPDRALEMLRALKTMVSPGGPEPAWLTCSGEMGEDALRAAGFTDVTVCHRPASPSSKADTAEAVHRFLAAGAALVLFCGGDGTARDVAAVAGRDIPILGIPSGVKMYSGVFGITPRRTADIVSAFLSGRVQVTKTELLDLDEERYRKGEWVARPTGSALTSVLPTFTQAAKAFVVEVGEDDAKAEIAEDLCERIAARPQTLFLLGPGTTVQAITERLGIGKTLLGVDAVADGRLVGHDLNERAILDLLDRHPDARLVVGLIGAQGIVLGRGNLQLSPAVIRRVGTQNIIVLATPAKLRATPVLRFDTGDPDLDRELGTGGYVTVVAGYHTERIVPAG